MIQGTMSNAGKSLLAAGLCRVLSQDGLRVAPFKSQNMALNSGVTADGLEMGRAQIMQAEACGISPDVRMNPILLKPESDHRSQLIVAGKAQGAFAARDYFARKKALMPQILEAFDSLAEENDVIVIEGAGSPAEINLSENDIVNMGLARAVSSPVLLAGDIDPGGVFAQLFGTVALLAPEDRALLRGLVVNKFRGDVEILRPGLAPLEKMCGVPVVGVVPYLTLDLDDEDSLAPRLSAREACGVIDVAVVRLPHLSNFTDFDPLSRVPGVGVRYVSSTTDLGRPDLVVLPGSKTTLDDARWLAASGIGACVRALSGAGMSVLGICGGYQLLGDELSDPHGREGAGTARGLGLIPASTVFKEEKRLAQSELRITGAGFKPPVPREMYVQVKNFFADLPYKTDLNPIELAAWTHAEFVRIHPFEDGNGRTSRMIMNYQLLLSGFQAVDIKKEDRLSYYENLEAYAVQGDLQPFTEMIAGLEEQRLDEWLALAQEQAHSPQMTL